MRRVALVAALSAVLAGCGGSDVPIDDLQAYLEDNYASASWYGDVTDVKENAGAVWVETDMYADSDAGAPAEAICAAVSAWQLDELEEFVGVSVRAVDGQRLVLRADSGASCTADV